MITELIDEIVETTENFFIVTEDIASPDDEDNSNWLDSFFVSVTFILVSFIC